MSKGNENSPPKTYLDSYVYCSAIHSDQEMETRKCPSVDEWKKRVGHMYSVEYFSVIKQNEFLSFMTT
jgi:hypothetical protein